MKDPKAALGDLHTALATHLSDVIRNGEEKVTEDGVVVRVKPGAATLNVIRQFLKDNGIEAESLPGTPINRLATNLPSFDEDGNVAH